ncbi:transcriptional regulator [Candidatus Dependentiae bacterium]|nr:transcriptional regulator [Candidatus Dependentiae bacterium]
MNKQIPFFNLSRQHEKYKNQIKKNIEKVLENQAFIGGNFVTQFENNFSKYLNVNHTVSCNSGTDALWMALKALNIKKNDIVLTTPFSFIASSSEILALGGHPVFIDIDSQTYNIDTNKLEKWINEECNSNLVHKKTGYRVVGILPVDIFGQCANYIKIKEIAQKHNLWIIQDSCQAVGAHDSAKIFAGNHGDISCFSFYPTKNLGAYGDGGCCTTNNPKLAEKLMRIRNHGRKSHYNYIEHGINSRLDGIQAAILDKKLKYIDNFNQKRIEFANIYNKKLSELNNIKLPKNLNGKHVYHQYCIELVGINREIFMQKLKEKGIGTNIYYPKGLNQIEFLNTDQRLKNDCPISDNLTHNIVALPIWPELEIEEINYVANQIKEILSQTNIQFLSKKIETKIR